MKKLGLAIIIALMLAISVLFVACSDSGGEQGEESGRVPIYLGMEVSGNIISPQRQSELFLSAYSTGKGDPDPNSNGKLGWGQLDGDTNERDEKINQDEPFEGEVDNPTELEEEILSSLEVLSSDKIEYYAEPNQVIYITIRLSNPDNYEILSFTLNGDKYQSFQFQDGSDGQNLILKMDVGNASGVIEYTIDAIKYVDGSEIKDVLIDGNQTVKAGVKTEKQVTALVFNEAIGLDSISFDVTASDSSSLVELSGGSVQAAIFDGKEIVATKVLEVGKSNKITFDSLLSNTLYQYVVFAYYDNLSGQPAGISLNVLSKKAFYTEAIVLFDVSKVEVGQEYINFDLIWHKDAPIKDTVKTELYLDDVKAGDLTGTAAQGLLSDSSYKIVATYKNLQGQDETITLRTTTLAKATPVVEIKNAVATKDSITFDLNITDNDNVGAVTAIELYKNGVKDKELRESEFSNLDGLEFIDLLSNNEYQIKVTYSYDLNDGTGIKTNTQTKDITTLAKATPVVEIKNAVATKDSITFDLDITDNDNVGAVTAIELYKGNEKVAQLPDLTKREFTGLEEYTNYTVKVIYSYNLNDGESARSLADTLDIHTLVEISATSVDVINTSPVSMNEVLYFEASITNAKGVAITKVKINGEFYTPSDGSTKTYIRVAILIDESYLGGDTDFTLEAIYYTVTSTELCSEIEQNNTTTWFINGELDVLSIAVVDDQDNPIDWGISGQSNYFLITLSNETGYTVKSITVTYNGYSGTTPNVFDGNSIIVINNNHIKVVNPDTIMLSVQQAKITSITYLFGISEKTKAVNMSSQTVHYIQSAEVVEIRTANDLKNMDGNKYYALQNDIDLLGQEWAPSAFRGVFDGNGYSIKNMRTVKTFENQNVDLGLFTRVEGVIQNLNIVDTLFMITLNGTSASTFDANVGALAGRSKSNIVLKNVRETGGIIEVVNNCGKVYAGGLVGYNDGYGPNHGYGNITGTIINCNSSGNVSATSTANQAYAGGLTGFNNYGTITNCYGAGNVSATSTSDYAYAGGLVGLNYGTITNCYSSGNVSASSVSNNAFAGGLAGENNSGTITNCYSSGNVSATSVSNNAFAGGLAGYDRGTITNCYSSGNVSVTSTSYIAYAGGLVGYNYGTITNCYSSGNVSVISTSYMAYAGGLVGENRGTITNCYRYDGQEIAQIIDGTTTINPTNTLGEVVTSVKLSADTFYTEKLKWDSDIWELSDLDFATDKYPTLK